MSFTRGNRNGGFSKPGEEMRDLGSRHSREGWTHVNDHESVYIDGKQYRHMREWSRPCAICAGPVLVYEKTTAPDPNSRFSNRTCKEHRGLLSAFEKGLLAWSVALREIVAGHKISHAAEDPATKELVRNLRDECNSHLTYIKELETELAALRPPTVQDTLKNSLPWT